MFICGFFGVHIYVFFFMKLIIDILITFMVLVTWSIKFTQLFVEVVEFNEFFNVIKERNSLLSISNVEA